MRIADVMQILVRWTAVLLLQMLISGDAYSQSVDGRQPDAARDSKMVADAGESERAASDRSLLRFCLLELRGYSERLDTLEPNRWRTVPKHVFHCHMLIEAEFMLYRYREVLGQHDRSSSSKDS